MKETFDKPPNAFSEPQNPIAVFPQWVPENVIDFRVSAMRGGGLVTRYTNRNDLEGSKSKKTKYPTIVKSIEDLEREEEEKKQEEFN